MLPFASHCDAGMYRQSLTTRLHREDLHVNRRAPRIAGIVWAGLVTVIVTGCAAHLMVPLETAEHPANPRAPAASASAPARALAPDEFDRAATAETRTPREEPSHAHHSGAAPSAPGTPAATTYTCPMHPEVREPRPGKCPKCGMVLVPEKEKE